MKLILQIGFFLILITNGQKAFSTPEMPPELEQIREIPNDKFCWVATREVKENSLALERSEQEEIENYKRKK